MRLDELKRDPLIIEWFLNIEPADNTRRGYLKGMAAYTEYLKKSPEEIIEEAEAEIKSGILMRKRKLRGYLLGFRDWLKERENAPKTINIRLVAVKSFYKSFDIDLPQFNQRKQFRALPLEENKARLEKEIIQKILKYANVRNRALILIPESSGLSQSDMLALRVRDFKEGFDERTMITTLNLRRIKSNYDFVTFLSPEATKTVLDYIDYRNRKPKGGYKDKEIDWEKRRIRSDDDYLFVKSDIPNTYLDTLDEEDRKLESPGLMMMLRELARVAGIDVEKGTWHVARAHNLRKYFNSTLLNNGADIFFTDYLMGHKIDAVHEAYFKADPKKLKERYMRYLPFLALTDTETYVIETEEYAQLKAKNEELERQLREIRLEMDSRKGEDENLNRFFADPEVQQLFLRKLKELGMQVNM